MRSGGSLADVITAIKAGADVIDGWYLERISGDGRALVLSEYTSSGDVPVKRAKHTSEPKYGACVMSMWDDVHITSHIPIESSCKCYTYVTLSYCVISAAASTQEHTSTICC